MNILTSNLLRKLDVNRLHLYVMQFTLKTLIFTIGSRILLHGFTGRPFLGQKRSGKNYGPFFEIEFFRYTKAFSKDPKTRVNFRSFVKNFENLLTVKRFLRKKVDFSTIFAKSSFLCVFSCCRPVFHFSLKFQNFSEIFSKNRKKGKDVRLFFRFNQKLQNWQFFATVKNRLCALDLKAKFS